MAPLNKKTVNFCILIEFSSPAGKQEFVFANSFDGIFEQSVLFQGITGMT